MSVAFQSPMTVQVFLAWEERQELRWEFDEFAPVAMVGGTEVREGIGIRLRTLLDVQLMGKCCRVRGPSLKIVEMGRIRYPDAVVSRTPGPRDATIIQDPIVVFEVLSPGTSRIDRIDKRREYRATKSIQRYVILEPDSIAATVYTRGGEDWIVRPLVAGDLLELPEIEVVIPLSEIFADVELGVSASDEPPEADSA